MGGRTRRGTGYFAVMMVVGAASGCSDGDPLMLWLVTPPPYQYIELDASLVGPARPTWRDASVLYADPDERNEPDEPAIVEMWTPDASAVAGKPKPAIVFVHGWNGAPYHHEAFARLLSSHGYAVIMPQLPAPHYFEPEYQGRTVACIEAATDALISGSLGVAADPDRIVIGGYSAGGETALLCAARSARYAAVFVWAPKPPPLSIDLSLNEVYNIHAPFLEVLAELDLFITPDGDGGKIFDRAASQDKQRVVIAGANHLGFREPVNATFDAPRLISHESQLEQAWTATLEFLDSRLKPE